MDLIGFFSAFLAEKLEKDVSTSRGLLRIAIKDQFGSMPSNISFDDLFHVFNKALRNRLMKLNIMNIDKIIHEMLDILTKRQALFTMANI